MKTVRFNRRAFLRSTVASHAAALAAALPQNAPVQQSQAATSPGAQPGYAYRDPGEQGFEKAAGGRDGLKPAARSAAQKGEQWSQN